MTKGFHKKTSKRQSLGRRYKIEKKVKQHNKKLKKLARKAKAEKKLKRENIHKEKQKEAIMKQIEKSKKMKANKSK